jgi:hypothetical protein
LAETKTAEAVGVKIMLLDIFFAIAIWAALVVFFVFYLAFAFLLFSPLIDYLIEAWKPSSPSASAPVT